MAGRRLSKKAKEVLFIKVEEEVAAHILSQPIDEVVALTESQRDRLKQIIRGLSPSRQSVGEAMAWCIKHAEAAGEISQCLAESLSGESTAAHKRVARLYLLSDILHNAGAKLTNASAYRNAFQQRLVDIMRHSHQAWARMTSRLQQEGFRARVTRILQAWEYWEVYPSDFLLTINDVFLGQDREEEPEPVAARSRSGSPASQASSGSWGGVDGADPLDCAALSRLAATSSHNDIDGVPYETKQPAAEAAATQPPLALPGPSCSFEPQPWRSRAADVSTERRRCDDQDDDDDDILDSCVPERAGDIDFINESPAILPDHIDITGKTWLDREDIAADQAVAGLLSEQDDQLTFNWSSSPDAFLGQREVFRGHPGPTFPVGASTTPIQVFSKYFDSELLDLIVAETNRNIMSIQQPLQQNSRFKKITPTTRDEIAVFLAVLILQGLCPVPVEKNYFHGNGFLTMPYFKRLMTYKRFVALKRLMHFGDSEASTGIPTTDEFKLRKLGPLLSLLSRRFSELYRPARDIAIDESLMKWHGRLSFAQRIATKAAKVGVKSYELCESSSGYLWKFFIYTGKGQSHGQTDDNDDDVTAPKNATNQIVINLVRPLLNLGHTLTMDNFYNSPLLARYLKANGTDCMGTLRVNREFVPEAIKDVLKRELRQGELVQSYCRDMSVVLWRDQNIVSLISTFHRGEIGSKEKYGKYRYKPQVVLDYNLSMGGVDKKDQLLAAYPMERSRNLVWYKKFFRRLLNVTILNAYIILKKKQPRLLQRDFRMCLANDLIQVYHPSIDYPLPSQNEVVVERIIQGKCSRPILSGNHFVGRGETRSKTCVWCRKARTAYKCEQCNVPLCLFICFKDYHTKG